MRGAAIVLILLLGALAPSIHAQSSTPTPGELEVKDPEGDVGFRPLNPVGLPVKPNLDLVALRVHSEDLEGLWLELRVKDLKVQGAALGDHSYQVGFRLEDPAMRYRAWFRPIDMRANSTPTYQIDFCAGPMGGYCEPQRAEGRADYANNALVIYLPKLSLMGRNAAYEDYHSQQMPHVPLAAGSRLAEFFAESTGDGLGDRLPNTGTGGPYALQTTSANDRLRLSLAKTNETDDLPSNRREEGAFPLVAVDANQPTSIKVDVSNLNGGKRIVNLTSSLQDPKSAKNWNVRITPTVGVPGNESRTVNLVVAAKPGVQHREQVLVNVLARSVGFRDELGSLTLRIIASVPPSPTNPTLYMHGASREDRGDPLCDVSLPVPFFCYNQFWLNTLEEDPLGEPNPPGQNQAFGFSQSTVNYAFVLDAPLSRDLTLSPKMPIEGRLRIHAAADGSATVRAYAGDVYLGTTTAPFKAGSTEPTVLSFLPLMGADRLPAGHRLRVDIVLSTPWSSPAGMVTPPSLRLKDSSLTLPIIADPNVTAEVPTGAGEAFITLSVKGDREEFVNPGEARAFHLTVVNEGTKTDTVTLASTMDGDGCRAEFRPGTKYRLDAGDSARFGVLVHAPSGAKEGAQCKVRVNATSHIDPASTAIRDLVVIITRGVDVADDSENYTDNADAASKLDQPKPTKKSPGPGVAGALVVAVLLVWRRRRSQV